LLPSLLLLPFQSELTMRLVESFTATVPIEFTLPGDFFFLESVPGGSVDVRFRKNGSRVAEGELLAATTGWKSKPTGGYDSVEVTSSLSQNVAFHVVKGEVDVNTFSGSVTVAGVAHTRAAKQVTNASQQILAANAARKYLFVQNQDPVTNLYVRGDGTAATADNGSAKLPPGAVWEPTPAPTGEVRGIMDAASAANNVHAIEG
jgi:hypothetical protein